MRQSRRRKGSALELLPASKSGKPGLPAIIWLVVIVLESTDLGGADNTGRSCCIRSCIFFSGSIPFSF